MHSVFAEVTAGNSPRVEIDRPSGVTRLPQRHVLAQTPAPVRQLAAPSPTPGDATAHNVGPTNVGMPNPGDIVLGFRITEKIGQGGFGSVFLAEQLGLADRPVALKFTSRPTAEPERMAALLHTNVVPVYSVHSQPPLQILCMPYRGRNTLADAVRSIAETKSLPATGAGLLTTAPRAKDDTRRESGRAAKPEKPASAARPTPQPIRDMLARLSFPESVVWLFAKLAEGLGHAHERGIVHLDLKPANVLITDDGMPMILDFGLSHDVRDPGYTVHGGTVRYMSPEHLEGFLHPDSFEPDVRMDLYSLGLMFFELLSGRHPFEDSVGPAHSLPDTLAARRAIAPRVSEFNRQVDPAVASVVAKLLAPDPADRYQTAHDLLTDLNRHRDHRPLKFAANPSVFERLKKFRRRHPVAAVCMIAALFAGSAGWFAVASFNATAQKAVLEAAALSDALFKAVPDLRMGLPLPDDARRRPAALKAAAEWFDKYAVGTDGWDERPAFARLPEEGRDRVRSALAEVALLAAQGEELNGTGKPDEERTSAAMRAVEWNRRAAACFHGRPAPPVIGEQAARLAAKAGTACDPPAGPPAAVSEVDLYVRGVARLADGAFPEAASALEELTEKEPSHAAGQFALAHAHHGRGRVNDALERLQLAKAMAPTDARAAFHRGKLLLVVGRSADARKEFDTAVDRDPTSATAFYHRAITGKHLRDPERAVADVTKAMELGEPEYHSLLFRAEMHEAAGDAKAAKADLDRAAKMEPADEMDYLARGLLRLRAKTKADYQAALGDFAKAAELNPRYLQAWHNQAFVLGECLGDADRALEMLDEVVKLSPEFAPARAGQAVLHARKGNRAAATKYAGRAVASSDDAVIAYQAACAHALLAKTAAKEHQAKDVSVALNYLRAAFRKGYADFANVVKDPDLVALRDDPAFEAAITAARELRGK